MAKDDAKPIDLVIPKQKSPKNFPEYITAGNPAARIGTGTHTPAKTGWKNTGPNKPQDR
jgi:hypothetical protein